MTLVPTDHSGFPHERAHYDRFWRKTVVDLLTGISPTHEAKISIKDLTSVWSERMGNVQ
jgi:hypothetical protein